VPNSLQKSQSSVMVSREQVMRSRKDLSQNIFPHVHPVNLEKQSCGKPNFINHPQVITILGPMFTIPK
jgi:hypothetical protein